MKCRNCIKCSVIMQINIVWVQYAWIPMKTGEWLTKIANGAFSTLYEILIGKGGGGSKCMLVNLQQCYTLSDHLLLHQYFVELAFSFNTLFLTWTLQDVGRLFVKCEIISDTVLFNSVRLDGCGSRCLMTLNFIPQMLNGIKIWGLWGCYLWKVHHL